MFSRGDIIWLDFEPSAGIEIQKRRPAFVLSETIYSRATSLIIVAPITSALRGWRVEVPLPEDLQTQGVVLTQQIRALDFKARRAKFIEKAAPEVTEKVMNLVKAYFE